MLLVIAPPAAGLDRQRVTRSTSWSVPTDWTRVPGWVSDLAHPCIVVGDAIVVTGSGSVLVAVVSDGAWSSARQLSLRVDGVEVATDAGSLTWSGDLSDGQTIELWARRTQSGVTFTTGSVDITPV